MRHIYSHLISKQICLYREGLNPLCLDIKLCLLQRALLRPVALQRARGVGRGRLARGGHGEMELRGLLQYTTVGICEAICLFN